MDNDWRLNLNKLNSAAWSGAVSASKAKKLDSSIKRNTGFIKKLKQGITKDSKGALLKDIWEVSLEKYLSEIIATATEVLSKNSGKTEDVMAAIEIISGLHQRFGGDFTLPFIETYVYVFETAENTGDDDDKEQRSNLMKTAVRIMIELYLTSLIPQLEDLNKNKLPSFMVKRYTKKEPILFVILREALNYRFKEALTTPISTMVLKLYPELVSEESTDMETLNNDVALKSLLRSLFGVYATIVCQQTTELNKSIIKLMKEHHKAQIRTGKETSEFLEEAEKLTPVFDRYAGAATVLCQTFNLTSPDIQLVDDSLKPDVASGITSSIVSQDGHDKLWPNIETKQFYEGILNLTDSHSNFNPELSPTTEDMTQFFDSFESIQTKDDIDDLSRLYWVKNMDNKATRRRLMRIFMDGKDWSKLPLYARFMANNSAYLSELTDDLIHSLDSGFRSQLHTNKINLRNIIFFAELVKFMLIPPFMVFHKIRTLVMNLSVPNNIEILTTLFESFGRFLINKPEFTSEMEKMMMLIKEKKRTIH